VESDCDEAIESIINSTEDLMERIQDLDMASDFHKIGGYNILIPLLSSPYGQLKQKGAELVGELVQNHEYCQKAAVDMNILEILVKELISDKVEDKVKVKTLYAVSCLIRSNKYAQRVFEEKNGCV
jgi:hsp70-interacting protein